MSATNGDIRRTPLPPSRHGRGHEQQDWSTTAAASVRKAWAAVAVERRMQREKEQAGEVERVPAQRQRAAEGKKRRSKAEAYHRRPMEAGERRRVADTERSQRGLPSGRN